MKKHFQLFLVIFIIFAATKLVARNTEEKFPIEISFINFDLKYNEAQGIKICEIQQSSPSMFRGYDVFLEEGAAYLADQFCNFLSQYQETVWFIKSNIVQKKFRKKYQERGWKSFDRIDWLVKDPTFLEKASTPVKDPHNVYDYHGVVIATTNSISKKSLDVFRKKYPGIIVLDAVNYPYRRDKYLWNLFFSQNQPLERFRPRWNLYPKKYSKNLAQSIINDIQSEIYVIKPRGSSRGNGIIMVRQNDLGKALRRMLNSQKSLKKDSNPSYKYWANDRHDSFLVEEFIHSDPLTVPHLNNRVYDPTIRIPVFLLYHQKKIHIFIEEGYIKLPMKSLSEKGSLIEKHKNYPHPSNFSPVPPHMMEKIKEQLHEVLNLLYPLMLSQP